jgi:putative ABC transport system permease protein
MRRDRVSHHDRHTSTFIIGVTPEYGSARRWEVGMGRFLDQQDESQRRRVAVLGSATADDLFPGQSPLGQQIQVGTVPLTVVGVLEAKGGASGSGRMRDDFILAPLSVAMRRLAKEDKVSGLRVNFSDPARGADTAEEVRQLLRARHKLVQAAPDDFTITTPEALVAIITRQARAMVVMLTFISAVSLFVSGIVIMNIMLVAVTQVPMESLMVSLLGGAIGFGLGALLSWLCTLAFDLPTAFSPLGFGLSFAFSAGVGLVFGLFPARRAAAMQPVESLR